VPEETTSETPSITPNSSTAKPFSQFKPEPAGPWSIQIRISALSVVPFLVFVAVLFVQFVISPKLQSDFNPDRHNPALSSSSKQPTCVNNPALPFQTLYSRDKNMTLLKEAQAIAAEFEYGHDKVRAAVKEFLSQMGIYDYN
jgi:hypothetical protein